MCFFWCLLFFRVYQSSRRSPGSLRQNCLATKSERKLLLRYSSLKQNKRWTNVEFYVLCLMDTHFIGPAATGHLKMDLGVCFQWSKHNRDKGSYGDRDHLVYSATGIRIFIFLMHSYLQIKRWSKVMLHEHVNWHDLIILSKVYLLIVLSSRRRFSLK